MCKKRSCLPLLLVLSLCGCVSTNKVNQVPAAAPSPFPIDFPLMQKWEWRGTGMIVGKPVADDERVYLTTQAGYCYAINRTDGKLVWMFKTVKSVPTWPILSGDRVIVFSIDDEYYELSASTGEVLSKDEKFGRPSAPGTLSGESLYFAAGDTQLRCYSIRDHKLQWKFAAEGRIASDPAVADGRVYFGALDGYVYCLRAEDGSVSWKCQVGGEVRARPALSKRLVVTGSTNNYIVAIDRSKGVVRWRIRAEADIVSPPTVLTVKGQERILSAGFDNFLYCLKSNGNWVHRTTIPARMYGEILVWEKMTIIASFSAHVVALDPITGNELGYLDLPSESRATPLLTGRTLYASMYDAETGETVLQAFVTQPPPPPQTQPAAQTQPETQTQPVTNPASQTQPGPTAKPTASVTSLP